MEKKVICTVCPLGCEMTVIGNGNQIESITGFTCKRGETFGRNEFVNPVRILTSSVKVNDGERPLVSVRSSKPVPLNKIFEIMERVKGKSVEAPVKIHDVIISDILGLGIDIIASDGIDKK